MAYERTLSSVEYDWVSLSYNKNSLSGVVLSVLCGFCKLEENDRRRCRTMAPRSKPFLYLTFVSPQQTFRVVFGLKKLIMLVQSLSFPRPSPMFLSPPIQSAKDIASLFAGFPFSCLFFSSCKQNQSWQAACWPRAPSRRACRGSPPTSVLKCSPLLSYDRQSAAKNTHIADDHPKK